MGHRRHLGAGRALAILTNLVAVVLVVAIGVARPSNEIPSLPRAAVTSAQGASHSAPPGRQTPTLVAVSVVEAFSRSGVMSPNRGIAVANLSVRPGHYMVQFAFDARFESPFRPGELDCGIVDNNDGGRSFLGSDPEPIRSGAGWARHSYAANFSLPDLTLGIRCFPADVALARASFRNVTLSVTATAF